MLNDPLANILSAIVNYERIGKKELLINPISKMVCVALSILQAKGYVGEVEKISPSRGGFAKLHLLGNVNKCGVIKPRFSVTQDNYEKFEKRYLPAKGIGVLIVSTSKGLMTHEQAQEQGIGGRLIAYCY